MPVLGPHHLYPRTSKIGHSLLIFQNIPTETQPRNLERVPQKGTEELYCIRMKCKQQLGLTHEREHILLKETQVNVDTVLSFSET